MFFTHLGCIQPIDMVKVRIQLTAGTAEAAGPMMLGTEDRMLSE